MHVESTKEKSFVKAVDKAHPEMELYQHYPLKFCFLS